MAFIGKFYCAGIALAFACLLSGRSFAQGKLFIIGGGSRPQHLVDRMIKESGVREEGYVIILPYASEEQDSAIWYAKKQFNESHIKSVSGIMFNNERLRPTQLDSIGKARLIYITGGDQVRFMNIIKNTGIDEKIKEAYNNGSMIAGTSAGAAVMSKLMITGNEKLHKEYKETFRNIEADNIEISSGLGLLPNAVVDQHFVKRSRHNRLISAVIEHPQYLGIGIDESTAILVKGSEAEVVGDSQVLVFANPKRSTLNANGKLGAKNLLLSVYLPGEKFKITTSKNK